jgi:hypothetical protein
VKHAAAESPAKPACLLARLPAALQEPGLSPAQREERAKALKKVGKVFQVGGRWLMLVQSR